GCVTCMQCPCHTLCRIGIPPRNRPDRRPGAGPARTGGPIPMPANILVVEDEPAIRDLLSVNLRHGGYRPIQASDAGSARRQIDAELPDLVLLDWMLPDESGTELARQLRSDERTRSLPIIMLTARSEEGDRLNGFDAGVD